MRPVQAVLVGGWLALPGLAGSRMPGPADAKVALPHFAHSGTPLPTAAVTSKSLIDVMGPISSSQRRGFADFRQALFNQSKMARRAAAPATLHNGGPVAGMRAVDDDQCWPDFDVLILQDATGSFEQDFDITASITLPAINTVPLNATFSLITFRDKPIGPMGDYNDDCLTVHKVGMNSSLDLVTSFREEAPGGGRDWAEGQFAALVAAISSPTTIPWRTSESRVPVVFLVTDSGPHFEGDGVIPEIALNPWGEGDVYDETKAKEYCMERYYPSPATARQALLDNQIYLGVVVMRPTYQNSLALKNWIWFRDYVGYPEDFVHATADELAGWFNEFFVFLETVWSEHCSSTPTFSPEGSTRASAASTNPTGSQSEVALPMTPASTVAHSLTSVAVDGLTTTPVPVSPPKSELEPSQPCVCPSQPDPENPSDPCCHLQPEVLVALYKQPEELDIHFRGVLHSQPDIAAAAAPAGHSLNPIGAAYDSSKVASAPRLKSGPFMHIP